MENLTDQELSRRKEEINAQIISIDVQVLELQNQKKNCEITIETLDEEARSRILQDVEARG